MKKRIFIALMGIMATMALMQAQAQEQRVVTNVTQVTIELKNNTTVTISEDIDSVVYVGQHLVVVGPFHPEETERGGGGPCYFYLVKSGDGTIFIDGQETAISRVPTVAEEPDGRIYDLSGYRRETQHGAMPAGIYIRNGRKIVIK